MTPKSRIARNKRLRAMSLNELRYLKKAVDFMIEQKKMGRTFIA